MEQIIGFLPLIIILVFSIVLHEVSHGYMAYALGDPTAKYAGRLTLNPIPHIDPIGSLLLPLSLILLGLRPFGWAKPVPINPANLRGKYDEIKVSVVGPLSNIGLAVIFGLFLRFLPQTFATPAFVEILGYIVVINLILGIFNLIPIPPLDGSHVLFSLLPDSLRNIKMFLAQYGFFILLFFIFFLSNAVIFPILSILFRLITGFPIA